MDDQNSKSETKYIAENSLDVRVDRLPLETLTLEEYRRLGGIPIKKQESRIADTREITGGSGEGSIAGFTHNVKNSFGHSATAKVHRR